MSNVSSFVNETKFYLNPMPYNLFDGTILFLWITFVVATDNTLISPFISAAALHEHTVLMIECRVKGPVSTFGDASADIC